MDKFPLTRLEIKSEVNSEEDDNMVFSILKKLYKGRINFGIVETGFKGLLVWKSQKYMGRDKIFMTVYDIKEY